MRLLGEMTRLRKMNKQTCKRTRLPLKGKPTSKIRHSLRQQARGRICFSN